MDQIDIDILNALKKDARLSVRQLSQQVHRSPTPVFERLRRLETEGVIRGYTIVVDEVKAGRGFTVLCNVSLKQINTEIHAQFADAVNAMPEVAECYNVSGSFDYVLKVQVPDMKTYRRFVTERLGRLDMLNSVQSVFVMEQIKSAL
ncbi:MAG: Lrp/AsnC family transcriptional regulator [Muribaculaceae bacterium]|nr:Lrp/AsnC family transcriptional regulator [Muribaculaceae bacterium]